MMKAIRCCMHYKTCKSFTIEACIYFPSRPVDPNSIYYNHCYLKGMFNSDAPYKIIFKLEYLMIKASFKNETF